MKFNEGLIVSRSAAQPDGTESAYSLIVSGDIYGDEDLILERNIYLSDSSYTTPTIYFNDANSVYIQEVNNQLIIEPNNFLNLRFDQGLLINAESEDNPIIVFSNYPTAYRLKGALFNHSQDSDQDFSVSTTNQKRAIFVSSSDDTVMFHAEGITPAPSDTSTWFSGSAYNLSAGAFDPGNFGEAGGRITQFSGDVITSGAIVGKNNSLAGLTGENNCLILSAQNSIYGTATTYGFYGDSSSLQNIGDDMFFFVSGAIGGRGQEGTAVFGGDVVTSGSLVVESEFTAPAQPAFLVRKSANNQDNIAIGTAVDVTLDEEDFDIGSNFASNTFTAPTTGVYIFTANVYLTSVDVGANSYALDLVTSPGTYRLAIIDPRGFDTDVNTWTLNGSMPVLLTSGQTAKIQVTQTGGTTAQTDIRGSGTRGTFFAGYLLG